MRPELTINRKTNDDFIICRHDVIINFFDVVIFLLPIFVTGTSFMLISSLVPDLLQNSSSFVQYLEGVLGTEFAKNVFNKRLLNAGKCQVYSFYYFWIISRKLGGAMGSRNLLHTPTHLHWKPIDTWGK